MNRRLSVLCYGDSNTWGYVPGGRGRRLDPQQRWPGVLQAEMGDSVHVSENGVNGRTVATSEPQKPWRNGLSTLMATLQAHKPLDWVVVMLGTNDLKPAHRLSVNDVLGHLKTLVQQIQESRCGRIDEEGQAGGPKVLLVAPPLIHPGGVAQNAEFDPSSVMRIQQYRQQLIEQGTQWGCGILALADLIGSESDGIHLDRALHERLGKAVAAWLKSDKTVKNSNIVQ